MDAADRAIRLKAGLWGLAVWAISIGAGGLIALQAGPGGAGILIRIWIGGAAAGGLVWVLALRLTGRGAAIMGHIHNPSGSSTPARREYSQAQALAMRGDYAGAVAAYELAVAEFHDDPEPYLRIARILRDHLEDAEGAVTWFKRARAEATIDRARELLVTQEIIEAYRGRLRTPARAIPELARLIERFPAHPGSDAARTELDALRRGLPEDGR